MKERIYGGVVFVPDVLTDRGELRRMKHSLSQREFKCVMNNIVPLHECVTVRRQELFLSIGGAEACNRHIRKTLTRPFILFHFPSRYVSTENMDRS